MKPFPAQFQAFLAAQRAGRDFVDGIRDGCRCRPLLRRLRQGGALLAPARHAAPETTVAPSPTAAATRLIEPQRISPTANTPSRLVASGWPPFAPVMTKPFSSSAMPEFASQSVLGSAPIKENRWRDGMATVPRRCRGSSSAPAPAYRPRLPARRFRCAAALRHWASAADALHQILRHGVFQPAAAHHHPDFFRLAGQIDHRLPGRIARAGQRHFLSRAEPRFDRRWPSNARWSLQTRPGWEYPAAGSARRRPAPRCAPRPFRHCPGCRQKRAAPG